MSKCKNFIDLEYIHLRYERLTSLIGILQQFTAELVEIAGAPSDSISNALFEIEMGMDENNKQLKKFFQQEGGTEK